MKWYEKVKPGYKLRPIPDWNMSERKGNQLPDPVMILAVRKTNSQSGVVFTVRTMNGNERELDACWFMEHRS